MRCVVTSTLTSEQLDVRLSTAQGRYNLGSAVADAVSTAEENSLFTVEAGSLSLVQFVPQQSEDQARPSVAVDIYYCQAGACATAGPDQVRLVWNADLEVAVRASAQAGVATASFGNVHLLWTAVPLTSHNDGTATTDATSVIITNHNSGTAAEVSTSNTIGDVPTATVSTSLETTQPTSEAAARVTTQTPTTMHPSQDTTAIHGTTTTYTYYNPYFRERRTLVGHSSGANAQAVWGALGILSRKAVMALPRPFVDAAIEYELSAVGSVEINGVVHDVRVQNPLRFSFNAPPQLVSVSAAPSEGTVLLTSFVTNVSALEVDAQDLPLYYTSVNVDSFLVSTSCASSHNA